MRCAEALLSTPGRLWERALSQQVASSRLPNCPLSRFPPEDRTPLGAHFAANRRPLLIHNTLQIEPKRKFPDLPCPTSLSIGEDSKEGADAGIAGERGDLNPPDSWHNHALETTFRPSCKRMPGLPNSRTDRFLVMVDRATFGPNRDPGVRT